MRIVSLTLTFCFLGAGAAFAQTTPAQKPDFSAFQFMTGLWTCTTTKDSQGHSVGKSYPFNVVPDSAGYWFVASSPHSKRYLSYDAHTSKWISTSITDDGGSYSDSSPGWSGGSIVFKDGFNSDGSPLGFTRLTKVSDREYTVAAGTSETVDAADYKETCKKD